MPEYPLLPLSSLLLKVDSPFSDHFLLKMLESLHLNAIVVGT